MRVFKKTLIIIVSLLFLWSAQIVSSSQGDQDYFRYRLYHNDKQQTVFLNKSPGSQKVANDIKRILSEADDRYFMMLTENIIKKIKNGAYVELVFSEPNDFLIKSVSADKVKIKKILLGLENTFGWQKNGGCNIIFGNPDYEGYNIIVTSNPHISEEGFINQLSQLSMLK